jgi:hypothetical protein
LHWLFWLFSAVRLTVIDLGLVLKEKRAKGKKKLKRKNFVKTVFSGQMTFFKNRVVSTAKCTSVCEFLTLVSYKVCT